MTGLHDLAWVTEIAPLLLRMGLVAAFVVSVAVIAERLGPFLGGMVASLPLYTGPVYLLLALEHDTAYLAASAVASLAICGANPVFVMIYAMLSRSRGTATSLLGGLGAWAGCAAIVRLRDWTVPEGLLFVAPIFLVSIMLSRSFTRGVALKRPERHWTDLVQRALLVAVLTGIVIVASQRVPAQVTGILSVMPILTTSLILVMQPRVGGPATAALLAHTLGGLVGMVLAFVVVSLTIEDLGAWPSLSLGLGVTLAWNLMLIAVNVGLGRRRSAPVANAAARPVAARSLPPPLPPPPLPPPLQPPRSPRTR